MNADLIKSIALLIVGFVEIIFALVFWVKGKNRESFYMGWVSFIAGLYSFVYGGIFLATENLIIWHRLVWIGLYIAPTGYLFSLTFAKKLKYIKLKAVISYLICTAIFLGSVFTPYFIKGISEQGIIEMGSLDFVGRICVVIWGTLFGFYIVKGYMRGSAEEKDKMRFFVISILLGYFAAFIIGGVLPLFVPRFVHTYITPFLAFPGMIFAVYSIFRDELFEIRIILTEILVGVVGALLLTQVILSEDMVRRVFGLFVIIIFLLMGYILIKVTKNEIKKTEEAETLAGKLSNLNVTLEQEVRKRTKQLKRSYKEVKERNEELEKFYDLVVGRELDMMKMKEELKKLRSIDSSS